MEHSGILIERVRAGDRSAFGSLLARHLPGLRAFVRLNMGPELRAKESCVDIVQSACRQVLENLGDFVYEGENPFRVYLYTTALRNILDKRRFYLSQKRDVGREVRGEASESVPALVDCYASLSTPSERMIEREEIDRMERAFDQLTPAEREIVSLRRVFGLSSTEIGERLGRDPRAVRRVLGAAILRLSQLVRETA